MTIQTFLKSGLIFAGGALCALFLLNLAYQSRQSQVLGANTQWEEVQKQIENSVQETEKEQFGVLSRVLGDITSAITGSPILAPLFTTTKEVTTAVDSVKSLPTDQKSAICAQICGN